MRSGGPEVALHVCSHTHLRVAPMKHFGTDSHFTRPVRVHFAVRVERANVDQALELLSRALPHGPVPYEDAQMTGVVHPTDGETYVLATMTLEAESDEHALIQALGAISTASPGMERVHWVGGEVVPSAGVAAEMDA
jgi:hypothetical protein